MQSEPPRRVKTRQFLFPRPTIPLSLTHLLFSSPYHNNFAVPVIVRAQQQDAPQYWLHSFTLVLLSGFGGGILTPVFLGQPSLMLANSLLVPLTAVAWYLTHHVTGGQAVLTSLPVKLVSGFLRRVWLCSPAPHLLSLCPFAPHNSPPFPSLTFLCLSACICFLFFSFSCSKHMCAFDVSRSGGPATGCFACSASPTWW